MDWTNIIQTFILTIFGGSGLIFSIFKIITENKKLSKEQVAAITALQEEMKTTHTELKRLYEHSEKRDNTLLNKVNDVSRFWVLQSKVNICMVKCIKNEKHNGDLDAAIKAVEDYQQKKGAKIG